MKKTGFRLGLLIVFLSVTSCNNPPAPATLPIGDLPAISEDLPASDELTEEPVLPISTPYVAIFDGFFNCRSEPSASSPMLVLIQGQQVTIIAQNQGWLYVTVQYFEKPCWVYTAEIPNLDQSAVSLVPSYAGTMVAPTFTLPPGTQLASPSGGGSIKPLITPPYPTDTQPPIPTNTSIPPPTNTPVPPPTNTPIPPTVCTPPNNPIRCP